MAGVGFITYYKRKLLATLMRVLVYIVRRRLNKLHAPLIEAALTRRERVHIPSREPGRYIIADLYYPGPSATPGGAASSGATAQQPEGPRPIFVNWHGGGFTIANLQADALYCARVARDAGIFVLDADYRKGPECPYPAAMHDVEDTLRWVAAAPENQSRFDAERVTIGGYSSGALLALVAASTLRAELRDPSPQDNQQRPGPNIRAVAALFPTTDLAQPIAEKTVPNPMAPTLPLSLFWDCYVPDVAMRADPRVSPQFADPTTFPPTVAFFTAEGDILRPEAEALVKKIREEGGEGRKVVYHMFPGVGHGFDKGAEEGTEGAKIRDEGYSLLTKTLREALSA